MTTTTRPYMSVSVQLATPDGPLLNDKRVEVVSWTAIRYHHSDDVEYTINAHHPYIPGHDTLEDHITMVLHIRETLDPALIPDWVPWPPTGWLASLEMGPSRHETPARSLGAEHRLNGLAGSMQRTRMVF